MVLKEKERSEKVFTFYSTTEQQPLQKSSLSGMRAKSKETFFDYGKKEDTCKKVKGCLIVIEFLEKMQSVVQG